MTFYDKGKKPPQGQCFAKPKCHGPASAVLTKVECLKDARAWSWRSNTGKNGKAPKCKEKLGTCYKVNCERLEHALDTKHTIKMDVSKAACFKMDNSVAWQTSWNPDKQTCFEKLGHCYAAECTGRDKNEAPSADDQLDSGPRGATPAQCTKHYGEQAVSWVNKSGVCHKLEAPPVKLPKSADADKPKTGLAAQIAKMHLDSGDQAVEEEWHTPYSADAAAEEGPTSTADEDGNDAYADAADDAAALSLAAVEHGESHSASLL